MLQISQFKALQWKRWLVYALIVLGIVAGLIFAYNRFFPQSQIVAVPVIAPEAKKAEDVPKITIQGPKKIVVYDKAKLGKKIPLPPEVASNQHEQPTATAELPKLPYGGTSTAFINMSTGKSTISVTPKERPLFGFGGKTTLGLLGGIANKGNVAILYASQPVFRVGPVNVGVAAGAGIIGTDSITGAVINISGQF